MNFFFFITNTLIMNCFDVIVHVLRISTFYFLYDFYHHEYYLQFFILLSSVLCDIFATFFLNLSMVFIIFVVIGFLDMFISMIYPSIIIFIFNVVLVTYYTIHDDTFIHRKKLSTLEKYLSNLENCSDETNECFICLENCKERKNLKLLPCSHCFHPQCIIQWFQKNKDTTCPVCKQNIIETDKTLLI